MIQISPSPKLSYMLPCPLGWKEIHRLQRNNICLCHFPWLWGSPHDCSYPLWWRVWPCASTTIGYWCCWGSPTPDHLARGVEKHLCICAHRICVYMSAFVIQRLLNIETVEATVSGSRQGYNMGLSFLLLLHSINFRVPVESAVYGYDCHHIMSPPIVCQ